MLSSEDFSKTWMMYDRLKFFFQIMQISVIIKSQCHHVGRPFEIFGWYEIDIVTQF